MNTNSLRKNVTRIGLAALTLGTLFAQSLPAAAQFLSLRSWGADEHGQLGNYASYSRYGSPQTVSCPADSIAIAAGGDFAMMLRSDGTVWAWGNNATGALGYTEPYWSTYARQTQGINNVRTIAAGGAHSLAIRTDNTVWAWGDNHYGELGIGTHDVSPGSIQHITPVQVQLNTFPYAALSNVAQVSAGSGHSLARTWDGYVFAWGLNFKGELGDVTTIDRYRAVGVPIFNVIQVAAGQYHSVALKSDGTVWAWGNNATGQLGDGTTTNRTIPVQVNGLSNVVAIAASTDSSAALKSDGTVWVWGFFYGTTNSGAAPTKIDGLANIRKFAMGQAHILASDTNEDLYVYGDNSYGQIGDPTVAAYQYPAKKLAGLYNIDAVSAGPNFSLVHTHAANVAGLINLQGIDPLAANQRIDLTFYSVGHLAFTRSVTVSADAYIEVSDLPRRNYTLRIQGGKWLQHQMNIDLTNIDKTDLNVTLLAGDANGDNAVDIADLLLLIAHYNKVAPASGYLAAADFNCDDINDISDLLLLIANYNKIGE